MRVLAVGGGSGGLIIGGGGSGYVSSGTFAVSPFQWIQVTVGRGGAGSAMQTGFANAHPVDSQAGGNSSFDAYISAAGGLGKCGNTWSASAGGSGGGQGTGCYFKVGTASGNGGMLGSSGLLATGPSTPVSCSDMKEGAGQGSFLQLLNIFTRNVFYPGAGGQGNTFKNFGFNGSSGCWFPGGGGGGGVLYNGDGPVAEAGSSPLANGFGGNGYGAGGGAGGYYHTGDQLSNYYAGGKGADGIVYIEW